MTTITERLAAMAARNPNRAARAPNLEGVPAHFRIIRWFDTICSDQKRLKESIEYFRTVIADAIPHMTAAGPLENLLAETPGLEHFYKGVLIDTQQIRRWLEEVYEVESARKYKWFMRDPEARAMYGELKTTEIGKLVKAEDDISMLAFQIRSIANVENHLMSVVEGFTTRNINLSRIVDIRKANLQEVWIDPTKGTKNV